MDVLENVRVIIEKIDPDARAGSIEVDQSLFDTGILDSLRMIDLISMLETKFSFVIAPDDLNPDNFDSIDSIASYVSDNIQG